jgi:hypothetical protein
MKMVLNWNVEVIVDFLIAAVGLCFTIVSYYSPKAKKIKSLTFIKLGIFCIWLLLLLDGLAFLFLNITIGLINGLILIPAALFTIIGVNYTLKESYYSTGLILTSGLAAIFIFTAFQPDAAAIVEESGYFRIKWLGLFGILGITFSGIIMCYLFYWGIRTWLNAPFLIKKEASIFFVGILFIFPIGFIFYLLYLYIPILILYCDFMIMIGGIIFLFTAIREPKILYILPFTIHRIIVKDREGHPLYDHDWSESNISETIYTGFLNAVQLMSEEVMNIGGVLNIQLENGILILRESNLITVGLVASKSSKLLIDSVIKFTSDFEEKFSPELKNSVKDMSQYDGAFVLIEKYFSNFPYKTIKSKKQSLFLAGDYKQIPLELENKLRNIFTNEEEYEAIKTELIKAPLSFISEFIRLHDQLKKEIEQLPAEDIKYLNEKFEKN